MKGYEVLLPTSFLLTVKHSILFNRGIILFCKNTGSGVAKHLKVEIILNLSAGL